jgi:hypothetical protein
MGKGKKIKKRSHSFCMMACLICLMHIGVFKIERFME